MSSRASQGWVPNQHGAWAMLAGPFGAGLILRARDGAWDLVVVPLFVSWFVGYFAFYAASLWLKAPASRRGRYQPALLTYASVSALGGLIAVALGGGGLLGWVLPYSPLLGGALWLAYRRHERAVLGGLLTVAAACLMTLVCRFPVAADLLAHWGEPAVNRAVAVTTWLFGYFFGTVLYVKTMIRERGRPGWLVASIGWHVGFTLLALAGASQGLTVGWAVFFALTVLRCVIVPALARTRPVTPLQIGLLEVGFTVLTIPLICLT